MRNRTIQAQLQKVQFLAKETERACGENIELQSHWAKYICVLSAGIIENAVKATYIDFANRTVSKPLARYFGSKLSPLRNPKMETILELAGAFKEDWRAELNGFAGTKGGGD